MANFPISDYAKSLDVHVLKRYYEKIKLLGIDPFLLSEKDFDAECLPPVEAIGVVSFLVLETSHYTQDQLKAFTSLSRNREGSSRTSLDSTAIVALLIVFILFYVF